MSISFLEILKGIRKKIAPPSKRHKDKKKYSRKEKHRDQPTDS